MCMSEIQFSKVAAFTFLDDLKNRFLNQFSDSERLRAIDLSLSESFKEVMTNRMVKPAILTTRHTTIIIQRWIE